ncbi:helix-turn-helix domain-containing protein [Janthinobacterium sp. RB2P8]|uniref:helix-turn-helix domain-containing protein n=1 Tax=Janthinobacterium sp. RB2P8 TaxID=3424191 RepID=UPI003F23D065
MAEALHVSPQAVSKWAKRGEVPPRRVRAVAELLGVTPQSISPEVFGSDGAPAKEAP